VPIYEYQCEGCAHRFEVKQSIKDDPISTCERCGKAVRRLISSPGIMFKGSGWYVTDYSDKLKPSTNGEQPASSSTEKKDGGTAATPAAAPANSTASPSSASTSTPPTSSSAPATK